jgi:hypothetical protein
MCSTWDYYPVLFTQTLHNEGLEAVLNRAKNKFQEKSMCHSQKKGKSMCLNSNNIYF